ncbi:response regulator transcription factor [bacterium AH-315-P15]|nr:response regulator transcription factor [bacterium AH-315-P15]
MHALVVDDDPDMTAAIRIILEQDGFEVETAIDGEEGLAKLRNSSFDLMILDLFMPGKDGLEVLCSLQDDNTLPQIPIIAISGGATHGTANYGLMAARTLGAVKTLYKPFAKSELIAAARALLPSVPSN